MQAMTKKQAYVLSQINRVFPRAYRIKAKSPLDRYQLDGKDCTAQVTWLADRGAIRISADGSLSASQAKTKRRKSELVGPRQPSNADALVALRQMLGA